MVAVPAAKPVMRPDDETVAILLAEEVHALLEAATPEPVSWEVPFTQAVSVPVMVGSALMVTSVVDWHPKESV